MTGTLTIEENMASDTQSTPETVASFGAKASSTGSDLAAGSGTRLELKIPSDDSPYTVTGTAIASIKELGNETNSSSALVFYTSQNDTTLDEAMRITSDGIFLVGQPAPATAAGGCEIRPAGTILCSVEAGSAAIMRRNGGTGTIIELNDSGVTVGTISTSGSNTSYNTSSDYRLKENVDYTWDATTRLKQLKPARFNFIVDDTNTLVDGFLAHEVSSIVPEAIQGTKDAMTAEVLYVEGDELPEGKVVGDVKEAIAPDYQGIDQSKLVPLLVKTIQELEARITALEI
jgi:hypothetical protein